MLINSRVIVALFLSSAATFAYAQTTPRTGQPPAATASEQETIRPTVTLVGCLYKEEQVPGRKPNVAEKAGILEDYILAGASASTSGAGVSGAVGTTGNATPVTGNMYKVAGPSDDQLKKLVGKRVSVIGTIAPEGNAASNPTGGPQPDRGLGPDKISLPDIKASSITETAGTCPAVPAPLK